MARCFETEERERENCQQSSSPAAVFPDEEAHLFFPSVKKKKVVVNEANIADIQAIYDGPGESGLWVSFQKMKREKEKESRNSFSSAVTFLPLLKIIIFKKNPLLPAGTPYEKGSFRLRLSLPADFPTCPPTAQFSTKIFHPNVSTSGDVCVNVLKRDWSPGLGLRHVLVVVRCLLVEPFPESALNEEAGRLLLEDYGTFAARARLMTGVHASSGPSAAATRAKAAGSSGRAAATMTAASTTASTPLTARGGANAVNAASGDGGPTEEGGGEGSGGGGSGGGAAGGSEKKARPAAGAPPASKAAVAKKRSLKRL